MAKIDIDIVREILTENEIKGDQADRIVRQLVRAAEKAADEANADKEPSTKKQFVIVVSDPHGIIPDEDLVGWVLQIPENASPVVALDRVIKASHAFNATRRGRKHPVRSIGESCECVGAKFLREEHVWVKTKLPVSVIRSDNLLPPDASDRITLDDLSR